MFLGLIDAHTNVIERSWNNIQYAEVPAVIGNKNIGKTTVNIDVPKGTTWPPYCSHRDDERRIEVCILYSVVYAVL